MARRILGIDLGHHTVKLALLQARLRQTALVAYQEFPARTEEEQRAAVAAAAASGRWRADLVVAAMEGTGLLVRSLRFPFSDPRKIEPVVGYELEGQVPFELDELVYDFSVLELGGAGARVMVVASPIEAARRRIQLLAEAGMEPDVLACPASAYTFLAPDEEALVVDVGHRTTTVVAVERGRASFFRALGRGMGQVAEALAASNLVAPDQAFQTLLRRGVGRRMDELDGVLDQALGPWRILLRQTAKAASGELGRLPGRMLVCGGGSLVPGVAEELRAHFGMPVATVPPLGVGAGPAAVQAMGLARAGASRQGLLNLRRGVLAPTRGTSLLRERALTFATAFVLALAFLVGTGWAKLKALEKEEAVLAKVLQRESRRVLDRATADPEWVLAQVRRLRRKKGGGDLPIPKASAYAILSEISSKAPGKKNITLDVRRIEIKATKIKIDGTAGSAGEVEQFAAALRKIKCFEKVEPGRTTEVTVGGEKRSEFTITISSKCM